MGFEKFSESYFDSNLEKVKRNYETGVAREKLSFQRKYPSANLENFVFEADLSKTGDLIRTFTKYRDKEGVSSRSRDTFSKNFTRISSTGNLGYGVRTALSNPWFRTRTPYRMTLESLRSMSTKGKASCVTLRPWKQPGRVPPRTSRRWRGQERSVLWLSFGRVYHLPRGWNKQETPRSPGEFRRS